MSGHICLTPERSLQRTICVSSIYPPQLPDMFNALMVRIWKLCSCTIRLFDCTVYCLGPGERCHYKWTWELCHSTQICIPHWLLFCTEEQSAGYFSNRPVHNLISACKPKQRCSHSALLFPSIPVNWWFILNPCWLTYKWKQDVKLKR